MVRAQHQDWRAPTKQSLASNVHDRLSKDRKTEIFDSKADVNEMALAQLDLAADKIGLDVNVRGRLGRPDRALIVSIPTRMDNGRCSCLRNSIE